MSSNFIRISMNICAVLALTMLSAGVASATKPSDPANNIKTGGQATTQPAAKSTGNAAAQARNDQRPNQMELENFDNFLDSHPQINRDLRGNPSLLDNENYVKGQPELEQFLRGHPGVRAEVKENEQSFMRNERGYQNKEAQLESLDRFLDGHPEINGDVRKDPALLKNDAFLKAHPGLKDFLDTHPGITAQVDANPQAFMRGERQYQAREDQGQAGATGNEMRARLEAFDTFLDQHHDLDQQLRSNPALLKDDKFVDQHGDLKEFLAGHPGIREDVAQNSQAFMKRERNYERQEEASGASKR